MESVITFIKMVHEQNLKTFFCSYRFFPCRAIVMTDSVFSYVKVYRKNSGSQSLTIIEGLSIIYEDDFVKNY